ncbi:MAG: histidine kinase [Cytophagaceae bacterium]|nr:histidine kinase [Cytophagaceae bacterium]
MKAKWIKYHVLFFLITWTFNYVFNFYFSIPANKLVPYTVFFILNYTVLASYFYTVFFLSSFTLKRIVYLIPLQFMLMLSGCVVLSVVPAVFYKSQGVELDFFQHYFISMFEIAFTTFSSLAFLFLQKWEESTSQKLQLIESLSEAELIFLRSQMSPHFLLNTLNSIYSMALNKSPEIYLAVAELKNIYSYVRRSQHQMSLQDEIDYLENFIKIQKRRFRDAVFLTISFKVDADYQIEPLLLSSFVENAFKHGVSMKEPSFITIDLTVTNGRLTYVVINSDHSKKSVDRNSGIGIQNLSRRLELLYPENFSLHHVQRHHTYTAALTIQQL